MTNHLAEWFTISTLFKQEDTKKRDGETELFKEEDENYFVLKREQYIWIKKLHKMVSQKAKYLKGQD